jgi:hypothetical protein
MLPHLGGPPWHRTVGCCLGLDRSDRVSALELARRRVLLHVPTVVPTLYTHQGYVHSRYGAATSCTHDVGHIFALPSGRNCRLVS